MILLYIVGDTFTTWYCLKYVTGTGEFNPTSRVIFDLLGVDAGILVVLVFKTFIIGIVWLFVTHFEKGIELVFGGRNDYNKQSAQKIAAITSKWTVITTLLIGFAVVVNNTLIILAG